MRLFLAIDFPGHILDYVSSLQVSLDKNSATLNLAKSYHLTLKFIGEFEENKVHILKKSLEGVRLEKFSLETKNIGIFKNWNYLSVIWLGLKESNELNQLHDDIEKNLSEFNFKKDFSFHPHITLARVSYVNNKEALKTNINSIRTEERGFEVNSFILYQSTLTPAGPIYKKMKEFTGS